MEIRIQPMDRETVQLVAALERECFADPWSLGSLQEELENPRAVIRVAMCGGEIAGYAGLHHVLDEGHITNVAVAETYRRQGVARALAQSLLDWSHENHLTLLTLEVRRSNTAAIALYSQLGFQEVGVRRGYYRRPPEDALLMTMYLQPQQAGEEHEPRTGNEPNENG